MMRCLNRLWKQWQKNSNMSSHFFERALRDITKNSRELLFNVDPLTTINLACLKLPKWQGTGLSEWGNACNETVDSSLFSMRIFPKMVIHLAVSVPLFTQSSPLLFYRLLRSQSPECKIRQPTRVNATKTHSLRLESELIDSNRVKVRHFRIF